MKRSYAGAAVADTLSAGITDIALVLSGNVLTDWPTGADGPFAVRIGRGLANEEKILVTSRTGPTLNIAARGYDETTAYSHTAGEVIECVGTATDLREANEHVNASDGVHGLVVGDDVVGADATQTLKHKTMDFGVAGGNVATNIPMTAIPAAGNALAVETAARVAADNAEITARQDADTAMTTAYQAADATEQANRIGSDNAITLAYQAADTDHALAPDPHAAYLTQTDADARYLAIYDPLPEPSSTFDALVHTVTATSWSPLSAATVKKTVVFAHDCWVSIAIEGWLAVADTATGADLRVGLKIDNATPPVSAYGDVLVLTNTASNLSLAQQQMSANILVKVAAGSRIFEIVAYKTAVTNAATFAYPVLNIVPIRWA